MVILNKVTVLKLYCLRLILIKATAEIYPFTGGEAFTIPLNSEDAFSCWNKESIPKKKWLLDLYTSMREGVVVTKIITRRKKKDTNDDKHLTKQRCNSFNAALFPRALTLSNPDHLKILRQTLRLVGIENIHAIHYDFADDFLDTKTVNIFRVKEKKFNNVKRQELHYLREFRLSGGEVEVREISEHLTQDLPHLSEEDSDEDIDTFIDNYFEQNVEPLPREKLVDLHNKSNAWVRKEKKEVNEQSFKDILNECVEFLLTELEYLHDEPFRFDLSERLNSKVYLFAAHAIVESHYIKLAQRTVTSRLSGKKHDALIEWETYKKTKRPPQRTIAKNLKVPLSTLNAWFKEFKQRS